jgi:hypothetical protein
MHQRVPHDFVIAANVARMEFDITINFSQRADGLTYPMMVESIAVVETPVASKRARLEPEGASATGASAASASAAGDTGSSAGASASATR